MQQTLVSACCDFLPAVMRGKGSQVAPGLLVERVGLPSPTATEHLARLKAPLEELGLEPDVLQGGVGKKARRLITDRLAAARSGDGVVLLATGSFLGECSGRPAGDSMGSGCSCS